MALRRDSCGENSCHCKRGRCSLSSFHHRRGSRSWGLSSCDRDGGGLSPRQRRRSRRRPRTQQVQRPMRPVAQSRCVARGCVQALLKAHAAGLQIQAVRACVASLHAQPQPARRAAQSRYVARCGASVGQAHGHRSSRLLHQAHVVEHVQRHVACGESDWGPWLASARVTGCPWLANKQALTRSRNGFELLHRHDVWRLIIWVPWLASARVTGFRRICQHANADMQPERLRAGYLEAAAALLTDPGL
jgi:hypothetical protein